MIQNFQKMNQAVTYQILSIDEIMLRHDEIRSKGVFILDQGWYQMIQQCSQQGMHILIPNLLMSPQLILQTIIRQNRSVLITSKEIWIRIKDVFDKSLIIGKNVSVLLF
jgi:hypothetical protein